MLCKRCSSKYAGKEACPEVSPQEVQKSGRDKHVACQLCMILSCIQTLLQQENDYWLF